jgi:hypothetical protein
MQALLCMFDKVFESFHFWHVKTPTKNTCKFIVTHNMKFDMREENKHMSIDKLEFEMTRITRQLKYYRLHLKYSENITHDSRRISYIQLHT